MLNYQQETKQSQFVTSLQACFHHSCIVLCLL